MALTRQETEPIVLGSGELYMGKVDNPEEATEEIIETALQNVGAIESGATLSYKPNIENVKAANRGNIMSFVTDEEVTFDCGILTWRLDNLANLAPATVTEDKVKGTKTIKIGGKGMIPVNYLRFIHTKKDGTGDIIVNMYKAQAVNGFQFAFSEKPTVVNYEFTALSDKNGNLVEIIETFPIEEPVLP